MSWPPDLCRQESGRRGRSMRPRCLPRDAWCRGRRWCHGRRHRSRHYSVTSRRVTRSEPRRGLSSRTTPRPSTCSDTGHRSCPAQRRLHDLRPTSWPPVLYRQESPRRGMSMRPSCLPRNAWCRGRRYRRAHDDDATALALSLWSCKGVGDAFRPIRLVVTKRTWTK
jgi:hypothetical protein